MPQITGELCDPGEVTENWSIMHRVRSDEAKPAAAVLTPFNANCFVFNVVVTDEGPVMVNEVKSNRIWQTASEHLQIAALQLPVTPFVLSK